MFLSVAPWVDVIGMFFVLYGLYLLNKEIASKKYFSQPIPESTILKPEIKSELRKQTEIVIKEEVSQPNPEPTILKTEIKPELVKQPEIRIKEEFTQYIPETTLVKTEIKPEITPKKVETKKKGLLNFKINRKIVSEKPIRSKIIKKVAKPQVNKKKCPFCGKEHDDPNVKFCHACGFKF